eukprot:397001_1
MSIAHLIKTFNVLNIDKNESTIQCDKLPFVNDVKNDSFIISDADEEILIHVEFTKIINLKSIKLFARSQSSAVDKNASPPKQIHIYKLNNLNVDFADIQSLNPAKSVVCSSRKLEKGQTINLQKHSSNAIKFKHVQFLAIYIESNQDDTEQTFFNAIKFMGSNNKHEHHTDQIKLNENKNIQSKVNLSTIRKIKYENKAYSFDTTDAKISDRLRDSVAEDTKNSVIKKCQPQHYMDLSQARIRTREETQCKRKLECDSITRTAQVLVKYSLYIKQQQFESKVYHELNIMDVNYDETCNDVNLLNDFIHLLSYHLDDFENIYNTFCHNGSCDLENCISIRRNQRDRSNLVQNEHLLNKLYFNDQNIAQVREQILDRIHCYFLHTFDIGYRFTENERQLIISDNGQDDAKDDSKDEHVDKHVDKYVKKIHNIIHAKKQICQNIELKRLRDENHKYTHIVNEEMVNETMNQYSYGYRYYYWKFYNGNSNIKDPVDIDTHKNPFR